MIIFSDQGDICTLPNKRSYLLRCTLQIYFVFMVSLVWSHSSLTTSSLYDNKNDDVVLSSEPTIRKVQHTNLLNLNSDELTLIVKQISAVDQSNMRLVCQYFSSFILTFKENKKYNWDSLQLLVGINSMEDWEHIRASFFSFSPYHRKNLLQVVTKDLVIINDGRWRGDVLRKLLQLPCDEWDDVWDCELAKKDIMYGFLKNQITIIIPFSIAGIILYPGSYHLLSHLILSGFSLINHNNLIDDFFRFERFLKNLGKLKFTTNSITWGKS